MLGKAAQRAPKVVTLYRPFDGPATDCTPKIPHLEAQKPHPEVLEIPMSVGTYRFAESQRALERKPVENHQVFHHERR
jgi:hypothetical protein